jgi:hypothetical protein
MEKPAMAGFFVQFFHPREKSHNFPCIVCKLILNLIAKQLHIVHFMQEYMRRFILLLVLSAELLIWGCDVPRNNPYDPDAENYLGPMGSIQGQATSLSGIGLDSALVSSLADTNGYVVSATTNSQGFFTISNIQTGSYQLVCTRAGYIADTLTCLVNLGLPTIINFRIDAIPVIQNFRITSQYIDWGDVPPFLDRAFFALITVFDADGFSNISSLNLLRDGYIDTNFVALDSASGSLSYHSLRLPQTVFPGDSIGLNLVGDLFACTVWDDSGASDVAVDYVERLLPEIPTLPPNNPIIQQQPFLREWNSYNVSYPYVYNVRIFDDSSNLLVWSQMGIPSTTLSVSLSLPLESYYWTLEIEDEYGNTARSRPDNFVVYN